MYKRILLTVIVMTALVMLFSGVVLAAPDELTGDEKGTAKLVELSKPEQDFSTFSNSCVVSGKSKQGVKVTIYIKKSGKETYEKLMVDGEEVSWTVGASGIFAREIGLERDTVNKLLIYAEKDDDFQIIKREITVKNLILKEILKNEAVKIEDLISKIMKD